MDQDGDLLRTYLHSLPIGHESTAAEPLPAGLRERVLAKMGGRVYWVGLEELARTADHVKGVPAGSTLAVFLKVLRPLVK